MSSGNDLDTGDSSGTAVNGSSIQQSTPTAAQPSSVTAEESSVLTTATIVVNSLSIAAAVLLILMFLHFRRKTPTTMDRTSLRIVFVVAVATIGYSATLITLALMKSNGFWCSFSVWMYIVFILLSVFLTAAIAWNLSTLFVHKLAVSRTVERWYYLISLGLALLVPTPAWAAGAFGYSPMGNGCWFKEEGTTKAYIWAWASLYIWLVLMVVYCFFVVCRVALGIHRHRKKLSAAADHVTRPMDKSGKASPTDNVKHEGYKVKRLQFLRELLLIVSRIAYYPSIGIVCQVLNVVHESVYLVSHDYVFALLMMAEIGTASQGVLLLMAFSLDPTVQKAYRSTGDDYGDSVSESGEESSTAVASMQQSTTAVEGADGADGKSEQHRPKSNIQAQSASADALERGGNDDDADGWGEAALNFF